MVILALAVPVIVATVPVVVTEYTISKRSFTPIDTGGKIVMKKE